MGQEAAEPTGITRGLFESLASISSKNVKQVYSKDFLLSFADLEHCKKRPGGIDPVVLRDAPSDLVDGGIAIPVVSTRGLIRRDRESDGISESPPDVPEWRRPSSFSGGSLLQQGTRRSELSGNTSNASFTSRPSSNWGDNSHLRNSFERPGAGPGTGQGRWEHRSGPGDRERERARSHHEWDSPEPDSGGRPHGGGSTSVRPGWVANEHDGLLGSGGGLRPVYTGGLMAPQARPPDRPHAPGRIGRTGEQYHPPRPGKVTTYSRREETDSINDETFGSEEWSSEERSEQERKRRESFEQMRKDHQRRHQELQKTLSLKREEASQSDSSIVPNRKHDENMVWDDGQHNEVLLPSSPGTPHSSCSKDDTSKAQNAHVVPTAQTPRPLVPPGFSKAALQKSSSIKENDKESKAYLSNVEEESRPAPKLKNLDEVQGFDKREALSTVLLDEAQISNREDDNWSHSQSKTSKFARWFHTEEDNSQEMSLRTSSSSNIMSLFLNENLGTTSSTSCGSFDARGKSQDSVEASSSPNLMSLLSKSENQATPSSPLSGTSETGIIGEEAMPSEASSFTSLLPVKSQGRVLPMPVAPSLEDVERVMTATATSTITAVAAAKEQCCIDLKINNSLEGNSHPIDHEASSDKSFQQFSELLGLHRPSTKAQSKPKVPPVFLTCEDLEQSMLAEVVHSPEKEGTAAESSFGLSQVLPKDSQKNSAESTFRLNQLLQMGSQKNTAESALGPSQVLQRDSQKEGRSQVLQRDSQKDMDTDASRHLLSLLQKGTSVVSSLEQSGSPTSEEKNYSAVLGQGAEYPEERETNQRAAELQTLETLFGKAFMSELRSVGAPVSGKTLSDDSVYDGKEDGLHSLLAVMSSSRQSTSGSGNLVAGPSNVKTSQGSIGKTRFPGDGGFDVEVGKGGRRFDSKLHSTLQEKEDLDNSLSCDANNDLWAKASSQILPHRVSGGNYDISSALGTGSFSGDMGHPQLPPHLPHQGPMFHPPGPGGHFIPSAQVPPRGLHFQSMHGPPFMHENVPHSGRHNDLTLHGMGIFPHDGSFHPLQGGVFHQPSHNLQGQSGQLHGGQSPLVGGAYGISPPFPSEFAGPTQMGLDLGNYMGGLGGGGAGMGSPLDKWFGSDSRRTSQGVPGISPYQHPVSAITPDRKLGYGNYMGGLGGGGGGTGLPLDKWFSADSRRTSQSVPGFGPYQHPAPAITQDRKLGYG